MFDKQFFIKNRRKLQAITDADIIVISANGLLQRNNDSPYKFRQDSNFWYLTGLEIPDAILMILPDGEDMLLLPKQSPNDEIFGTERNLSDIKSRSGIDNIKIGETSDNEFQKTIKDEKTIGFCGNPKDYSVHYGMYINPAHYKLQKRITSINPKAKLVNINSQLAKMRVIKTKPELKAIQTAVDITSDTLNDCLSKIDTYKYEYQVEADILQGFYSRGASGAAFNSIVASGKNTCHLHYQENNDKINGQLMYLDIGAEVENYAADITRSYILDKSNSRINSVYDAVNEVAQYARSLAKPGATIRQNEQKIRYYMGQKLQSLGLITTNTPNNVRKFYPHSTSHYLGLDVHDVGDYDMELEPNMVFTIEPGIYIPDENIGIRIEDDICITKTGHIVMSNQAKPFNNL